MLLWLELSESSGGILELSKCFNYLMSWKFDAERQALSITNCQNGTKIIVQTNNIHNTANRSITKNVQKDASDT